MVSRRSLLLTPALAFGAPSRDARREPRLGASFKRQPKNGWTYVHLEGAPRDIGFQHGYWLHREIAAAQRSISFEMEHDTEKPWSFFHDAAREFFWPKVEQEYREELEGIAEGLQVRGSKLDVWDMVALNAWLEWSPYFLNWYNKRENKRGPSLAVADRCSAFVATGSYTKDGNIVIGHNAWTGYIDGVHWSIIFDIVPKSGKRIFMDGYPGLIHSGDDFGVNSAGIAITETTITQFDGFNPDGKPEFMRARKAMQYSNSIDDFARIMQDGNNGGYANTWLVGDRKTKQIGSLELGLIHATFQRSSDGYFCGSNFPSNPKLVQEETKFDVTDKSLSPNARRIRWEQLMAEYKGRIDAAAGRKFLTDHVDSFTGSVDPNERTLCGHNELSPRGMKPWQPEFGPAGAVQAKVMDSKMAERMAMTASLGHGCGKDFKAAEFLKKHPQFAWMKDHLRDMPAHPWTLFESTLRQ